MSDIVERLREGRDYLRSQNATFIDGEPSLYGDAADEIERLRAEVANLTDDISRALQTIAAENEENERLRARLEVDDSGYDGISCRDETIKNQDAIIDGLRARVAELEAAQAWRPIESAPRDGTEIVVFAPGYRDGFPERLPDIISLCAWHEDAGFCVDELRWPTLWVPAPPKEGA